MSYSDSCGIRLHQTIVSCSYLFYFSEKETSLLRLRYEWRCKCYSKILSLPTCPYGMFVHDTMKCDDYTQTLCCKQVYLDRFVGWRGYYTENVQNSEQCLTTNVQPIELLTHHYYKKTYRNTLSTDNHCWQFC